MRTELNWKGKDEDRTELKGKRWEQNWIEREETRAELNWKGGNENTIELKENKWEQNWIEREEMRTQLNWKIINESRIELNGKRWGQNWIEGEEMRKGHNWMERKRKRGAVEMKRGVGMRRKWIHLNVSDGMSISISLPTSSTRSINVTLLSLSHPLIQSLFIPILTICPFHTLFRLFTFFFVPSFIKLIYYLS